MAKLLYALIYILNYYTAHYSNPTHAFAIDLQCS